jgi:NADPH-dependent 2,4-dienoyl-CoA reductase/sulfur reductase-like enzyme
MTDNWERDSMDGNRLVIIGGSDAGISAALRAREVKPSVEPILVVADAYPNFSICGLPFYLSGEVTDWRTLAHRTRNEIERENVRLLLNHSATAIHAGDKIVQIMDADGRTSDLSYDRLIMGTGAESIKPPIKGIDLPGVFLLRWMDDSFAFHRFLTDRKPQSAVIIGGGYIGMEMADALTLRGLSVTVAEFAETVLTTLDGPLGEKVAGELERHGVEVATGVGIESIEAQGQSLTVQGSKGFRAQADLVLVAVGCRPSTTLAVRAGIETGLKNAIKVNRRMETNIAGIYAAGDCAETWHKLLECYTYLPLGTTAHKQGRVAGENAVGGDRDFAGSLGTQAVKIFDLVAARTGLRDVEAREAGFDPFTNHFESWDHKVYYPGAEKIMIRITGDRKTGRLLGAQIIGHRKSEVSKRIDIFAASLFNDMLIEDLNDLDLSYTPPLSSPWDPVQMAAQAWLKDLR